MTRSPLPLIFIGAAITIAAALGSPLVSPQAGVVVGLLTIAVWFERAFGERLATRLSGLDEDPATAPAPLASLESNGFTVLADVMLTGWGAAPVHVVAGRTGVFVVEPKHLPGRVEIRKGDLWHNGRRKSNITLQVCRAATRLQTQMMNLLAELNVEVEPMVCIRGSRLPWARSRVEGVTVVDETRLVRDIEARPEVLDDVQAARLGSWLQDALGDPLRS